MRELTYLVATSLDGYIADPSGGHDAFPTVGDHIDAYARDFPEIFPAPALDALGITPRNETFDTVLMGWNTFAVGLPHGLDDPYPHLRQVVFSRKDRTGQVGGGVEVIDRDPVEVVRELKAEPAAAGIWLCGGSALAGALCEEIDRLVLKVNPVLLGAGLPLLGSSTSRVRDFERQDCRTFDSGVVVLTYRRST
ncbi:MAG: dihydrofolate reductase family protein [Acidimicrobiales bacterium]|nr:dihydrofolate reductase family protein [Acidimicrobiales bacterium]